MEQFIIDLFSKISDFNVFVLVFFVFGSAIIQQFFPPYPSDSLLLLMGVLAAGGKSSWLSLLISYFLGSALSGVILYEIGYKNGERLLSNKYILKCFNRESQEKAKKYANKIEGAAFIVCRFVPGMYSVMLLVGGIVRLKRETSWLYITLSSLAGCLLYFSGGLVIGNNLDRLKMFAQSIGIIGILLFVIPIAAILIYIKVVKRKKKS